MNHFALPARVPRIMQNRWTPITQAELRESLDM